jgi:hypothetical protein
MFVFSRLAACIGLCALLVLLAPGCKSAPPKVDIAGKVTKDGAPLKVGQNAVCQISFYPEVEQGENYTSHPATFDRASSTFTVKGIPVGKYHVSIELLDPYPGNDIFKRAFRGRNSPIVREVTGKESIDIDLDKVASNK